MLLAELGESDEEVDLDFDDLPDIHLRQLAGISIRTVTNADGLEEHIVEAQTEEALDAFVEIQRRGILTEEELAGIVHQAVHTHDGFDEHGTLGDGHDLALPTLSGAEFADILRNREKKIKQERKDRKAKKEKVKKEKKEKKDVLEDHLHVLGAPLSLGDDIADDLGELTPLNDDATAVHNIHANLFPGAFIQSLDVLPSLPDVSDSSVLHEGIGLPGAPPGKRPRGPPGSGPPPASFDGLFTSTESPDVPSALGSLAISDLPVANEGTLSDSTGQRGVGTPPSRKARPGLLPRGNPQLLGSDGDSPKLGAPTLGVSKLGVSKLTVSKLGVSKVLLAKPGLRKPGLPQPPTSVLPGLPLSGLLPEDDYGIEDEPLFAGAEFVRVGTCVCCSRREGYDGSIVSPECACYP